MVILFCLFTEDLVFLNINIYFTPTFSFAVNVCDDWSSAGEVNHKKTTCFSVRDFMSLYYLRSVSRAVEAIKIILHPPCESWLLRFFNHLFSYIRLIPRVRFASLYFSTWYIYIYIHSYIYIYMYIYIYIYIYIGAHKSHHSHFHLTWVTCPASVYT